MRIRHYTMLLVGLLMLALPGFAFGSPKGTPIRRHHHPSTKHETVRHSYGRHSASRHSRSRRGRESRTALHREPVIEMPAERVTQIQTALIKQGYMTGEPTGTWDAQTIAAMQKLQSNNGWQTKVTPDSRALIKLGLGPQAPGSASASVALPSTDPPQTIAQTPPQ